MIFRQLKPDVIIVLDSKADHSGSGETEILWKMRINDRYGVNQEGPGWDGTAELPGIKPTTLASRMKALNIKSSKKMAQ